MPLVAGAKSASSAREQRTPASALPTSPAILPSVSDMTLRRAAATPTPSVELPVQSAGMIQRAISSATEPATQPMMEASQPIEAPTLNLDQLARQIYPLIKRMLSVERERRPGR
jgi:hypothetical protein